MQNQTSNKGILISLIVVIIIIGLIVYSFIYKNKNQEDLGLDIQNQIQDQNINVEDNQLVEQEARTTNNNMEQVAKNGDVLVMNYTGRLTDGTVFDSNVDPKFNHVTPFEFTLGAGQVILGWDEGLVGMKVGEKKTLTVPPEKGYGSRAVGPIPANSTLIFEVELVGIK